jgi:hypothetical protein
MSRIAVTNDGISRVADRHGQKKHMQAQEDIEYLFMSDE